MTMSFLFCLVLVVSISQSTYGEMYCNGMLTPSLRELADRKGKFIGSMADWFQLDNPGDLCYDRILGSQYNLITANDFYWVEVEPSPGNYNWQPWETSYAFAYQHNQTVRCHNLVWQQSLPSYINSSIPGPQLKAILQKHVQTIVSYTKGKCFAWDVINEPIANDGSGVKQTLWAKALGGGAQYLATILQWVRDIDPSAKLFLNDYGIEPENKKSDALYSIAQQLLKMKAPLDGIGLESHFNYKSLPDLSSIASNMKRFGSLGLDVHVTELDVSLEGATGDGSDIAPLWKGQGDFYGNYLEVCLNEEACKSFETWSWSDRFTWLGDLQKDKSVTDVTNCGYMFAPLPFDTIYKPKPAAYAMQSKLSDGQTNAGSVIPDPRHPARIIKRLDDGDEL